MNTPQGMGLIALLLPLSFVTHTAAAGSTAAAQPKTEELQGGRWVEVDPAATQPAVDPSLARIEQLINDGRYSDASKSAVTWLKSHQTSSMRDRALFLNAEALSRYGNRIKAFYYLDELMDEYPASPLFGRALEKQYQIADDFLKGYKSRFFYMPILNREEEAVEMLYRIQQRSPGSPLAEKALLRTADHYYDNRDYDLAADAYAAYARSYPRSPELARVKLQQANSNLRQFRGYRFDATPVIDARAQLAQLQTQFPDYAAEQGVAQTLQRIDQTFAQKLFITADYYARTKDPEAAVYNYRYLINAYPASAEAEQAKARLARMPERALGAPAPGGGAIGVPSTQPASTN